MTLGELIDNLKALTKAENAVAEWQAAIEVWQGQDVMRQNLRRDRLAEAEAEVARLRALPL